MRVSLGGHWLLGQDFLESMIEAADGFVVDQQAYQAFIETRSRTRDNAELFVRDGDTAHIVIRGVLTAEPDFFFDMFGGGSAVYGDIIAAVAAAEGDEDIKRIVLEIDSPGGETSGFLATAQTIAATGKPVTALVTNMAASAAFGLATQADNIMVEDNMTMVGSVGVATTMIVDEGRIQITSTEAPEKRPDAATEEGRAVVVKQLDAIHRVFATQIAVGRDVTVEHVNANFGRGGLVIAEQALQKAMIDGISSASARGAADGPESDAEANSMETDEMNLSELKSAHPDLCEMLREEGIALERDRVTAHIKIGTAVGDLDMAAKYIEDGSAFTSQTVQADYQAAQLKRSAGDARVDDNEELETGAGHNGKTVAGDPKGDPDAHTDAIFDQVGTDLGLTHQD